MTPLETYQSQLKKERELRDQFENQLARLANLRLMIFIPAIGALGYWLFLKTPAAGIAGLALFGIFAWIAKRHQRIEQIHARYRSGCQILEQSILRLEDRWPAFADTGAEFADPAY